MPLIKSTKYISHQAEKYGELTNWSVYFANSEKLNELGLELWISPLKEVDKEVKQNGRLPNPFDYSIDLDGWKDAFKDDITGKHDFGKMLQARKKENGLLIIYLIRTVKHGR